jgi:Zn-dependent protease
MGTARRAPCTHAPVHPAPIRTGGSRQTARAKLVSLQSVDFVQILVQFGVLLVSLTVHEAAHAWTADRLGDSTARQLGRVSLNPAVHVDLIGTVVFPLLAMISHVPLIGWARPVPVNLHNLPHPRRDYLFIAAAGPASNLCLAVLAAVLFRTADPAPGTVPYAIIGTVLLLNVLLAVFNMVPIPPLDGGNVLAGLLPESLAASYYRLRPYGVIILYALMLTGILWRLVRPVEDLLLSWLL